MSETLRIRCAVCRTQKVGEVKGNTLVRDVGLRGYEEKVKAHKIGDSWVCDRHKNCRPFSVTVGQDMVWVTGKEQVVHLEKVTKVTATGFQTRGSSYNSFGTSTRGTGPHELHPATVEEMERYRIREEDEKQERDKLDQATKEREAQQSAVAEAFRALLPESLRGLNIGCQKWSDGDFEISLHVSAEALAVK